MPGFGWRPGPNNNSWRARKKVPKAVIARSEATKQSPKINYFWLVLSAVLAGLFPAYGQALRQATFIPQWIPQAQFAGYYVAYEKGYYREKGIDLQLLKGGPERPPSEWLEKEFFIELNGGRYAKTNSEKIILG